jgi:hypothetical protein
MNLLTSMPKIEDFNGLKFEYGDFGVPNALLETSFERFALLIVIFLFIYGLVRLKENEVEDKFLALKSGLYVTQIAAFLGVLTGVYLFLNFLISLPFANGTTFKYGGRGGLGLIAGSGVMVLVIEFILVKVGTELNYKVRSLSYGILVLILGMIAVGSFAGLIQNFLMRPKGSDFHRPLTATIVFLPAFVGFVVMYYKMFENKDAKQTFLPQSFVDKANEMVNKAGGDSVAAGLGAAAVGGAAAGGQPGGFQQQQPVQQQQAAPQQQAAAAPQQGGTPRETGICAVSGQQGEYVAEHNMYYCRNCAAPHWIT